MGRLRAIGDVLARASGRLGRRVDVDVLALLGERAALAGLSRGGDVSCGGAARLLRSADGWLAVNLPRPDDLDLLCAWLPEAPLERLTHKGCGPSAPAGPDARPAPALWSELAAAVASRTAHPLVQRAQLLGLAVAALPPHRPEAAPVDGLLAGLPVAGHRIGTEVPPPAGAGTRTGAGVKPGTGRTGQDGAGVGLPGLVGLVVADLSSLWAGPLCGNLLQRAGARVIKVESVHRPDGARRGPAPFFDLLHAGQDAVGLDFRTPDGRADLRRVLESVDVVVEGSRPRALEQLGLFAEEILAAADGPRVWVSITGYGRSADGRDKVAFGDDAAVAGGLVVWDEAGPCFCADAVADPCAGLVAAAATLEALSEGGRRLLDVSMRDVAAHLAGPGAAVAGGGSQARWAGQPVPCGATAGWRWRLPGPGPAPGGHPLSASTPKRSWRSSGPVQPEDERSPADPGSRSRRPDRRRPHRSRPHRRRGRRSGRAALRCPGR